MALKDKVKALSNDRSEAIEKLTEELYAIIGKGEDELYKEIIRSYLLKELTVAEDGTIKNIPDNFSSTFALDKIFKKMVGKTTAPKIIQQIQKGTAELNKINSRYFDLFDDETVQRISEAIEKKVLLQYGIDDGKVQKESALANAAESQEALKRVKALVQQAIASEAKIYDLEAALKIAVVDEGLLKKYLDNTAVTNVYDRYDRQTTQEYSKALQLNYAIYQGGVIRDSRDFCIERNAKVFTREEIGKFGTKDDEYGGYTNKSAGEFKGKFKPSTKIYDPYTDCGCYNCRHHWDWISDEMAVALRPGLKVNKEARHLNKRAKAVGDEVQDVAKGVADKFDAKVTPINFKSVDSIERKARTELDGDVSQVKDSVRNTIVSEKAKLKDIVAELEASKITQRVKYQDLSSGYRGYLINVKASNGTYGEIQVNTPKMIYAKEKPVDAIQILGKDQWEEIERELGLPGGLGHELYEKIRQINPANTDPDSQSTLKRLLQESVAYYKNFYD